MIKRGPTVISHPAASEIVRGGDELVVVGLDSAIDAFVEPKSE